MFSLLTSKKKKKKSPGNNSTVYIDTSVVKASFDLKYPQARNGVQPFFLTFFSPSKEILAVLVSCILKLCA